MISRLQGRTYLDRDWGFCHRELGKNKRAVSTARVSGWVKELLAWSESLTHPLTQVSLTDYFAAFDNRSRSFSVQSQTVFLSGSESFAAGCMGV